MSHRDRSSTDSPTAPPRAPAVHRRARDRARAALALVALACMAWITLTACPAWAAADDIPRPDQDPAPAAPTFQEALSVSWALVPVVVRTRNGYARGLGHQDFRLWVDGRRVPIDQLDLGSDAPLSVVWLQDLSGSMANAGKLDASRLAFETFLDGFRPGDEIAIAGFAGGRIQVEVPFTDSLATLRESAATWEGYGTTALHDAVSLLPEISAEGSRGKRVAVLVTDGQDNASRLSSAAAVELVRRARIPVYVLGLRAFRPGPGKNPGKTSRDRQDDAVRYAELLSNLAERTGGRYVELTAEGTEPAPRSAGAPDGSHHEATEVATAVRQILDDLRLRYILAVTTAGEGPSTYHEIRVELAHSGLSGRDGRHTSLTYRRGYWGTPPIALSRR